MNRQEMIQHLEDIFDSLNVEINQIRDKQNIFKKEEYKNFEEKTELIDEAMRSIDEAIDILQKIQ